MQQSLVNHTLGNAFMRMYPRELADGSPNMNVCSPISWAGDRHSKGRIVTSTVTDIPFLCFLDHHNINCSYCTMPFLLWWLNFETKIKTNSIIFLLSHVIHFGFWTLERVCGYLIYILGYIQENGLA